MVTVTDIITYLITCCQGDMQGAKRVAAEGVENKNVRKKQVTRVDTGLNCDRSIITAVF